ncbi:MAG TPA: PAS domain-containing protein [Candidatus Binatus sp.]|nr:PAS domain-containing protein [Candidatus Binatus sp.]
MYTDPAGRCLDANEAALELLGLTLDDRLTSPPDRFAFDPAAASDAEQEALRQQWDVGDVLREWRAAERALAELEPGSPDWARLEAQIGVLRARYQALFVTANPADEPPSPWPVRRAGAA